LDGRTVSLEGYRFGYQGSEKDNEFKGDGNSYTTEFRQLDPRLGRWLSVDALTNYFPGIGPYVFANNMPLLAVDRDGKIVVLYDVQGNKVATISNTGTIIELGMENSEIVMQYFEAKNYIQDYSKNTVFQDLENNDKILEIRVTEEINTVGKFTNSGYDIEGELILNTATNIWEIGNVTGAVYKNASIIGQIQWNPKMGAVDSEGNNHSPAMILTHELFHSKHFIEDLKQYVIDRRTEVLLYGNMEEKKTINQCNEVSKSLPNNDGGNGVDQIRESHKGFKTFAAESTISNTNPNDW
jgi:RHS repeat-associated protein